MRHIFFTCVWRENMSSPSEEGSGWVEYERRLLKEREELYFLMTVS